MNAARAGIQYLEDDARSRMARAHAMGPTPLPETILLLEQFMREYAERPLALAGIQGALARAFAAHGEIGIGDGSARRKNTSLPSRISCS